MLKGLGFHRLTEFCFHQINQSNKSVSYKKKIKKKKSVNILTLAPTTNISASKQVQRI